MVQQHKHGILRRYRVSLVIVSIALVSFAGGLLVIHSADVRAQRQEESSQAKQTLQFNSIMLQLKVEAFAKAQAKKIAIAEAKALAKKKAAQRAALQAQSATTSGPIDSKDCTSGGAHSYPASLDVIVNKKHCIQPLGFVPPDLTTISGATISAKASSDFAAMVAGAKKAGLPFSVTSSYRSYQTQISTYNYWVGLSGVAGADTYSARPGYSEHQTGLSVDLTTDGCALSCFGSTAQYAWLQKHAADYGFIQRYYRGYENITGYSAEEWHYRYVGVSVAQAMKASGVKTLEQYWGISGGDY